MELYLEAILAQNVVFGNDFYSGSIRHSGQIPATKARGWVRKSSVERTSMASSLKTLLTSILTRFTRFTFCIYRSLYLLYHLRRTNLLIVWEQITNSDIIFVTLSHWDWQVPICSCLSFWVSSSYAHLFIPFSRSSIDTPTHLNITITCFNHYHLEIDMHS